MGMTIRLWLALVAARVVKMVSRLTGKGGSSLPGLVARRIFPGVLSRAARDFPMGAVLLTGTNGKTTTASLTETVLSAAGHRVVHNRSGANLILGLTAAAIDGLTLAGRPRGDVLLLETDEATMPRAALELTPRLVAVTNFFRDQLDRYGELSTTVDFVARALSHLRPDGQALLNADDPHAAWLGRALPASRVRYYGVEADLARDPGEDSGDAIFCPGCALPLRYSRRYYAHLGSYVCPACGFHRPEPDVALERVEDVPEKPGERLLFLRNSAGVYPVPFNLPGTYNIYNALAAASIGLSLGVAPDRVAAGFRASRAAFGRMEQVYWDGHELRLALVKNPTGFNQVLAALAHDPRPKDVMIAINDRYADGRDVSWLWDVDFEGLVPLVNAGNWWVSGLRAKDMAVRLKYAGIPRDRVTVHAGNPGHCLSAVMAEGSNLLYILPTYTAMLEVRDTLQSARVVRHFREG